MATSATTKTITATNNNYTDNSTKTSNDSSNNTDNSGIKTTAKGMAAPTTTIPKAVSITAIPIVTTPPIPITAAEPSRTSTTKNTKSSSNNSNTDNQLLQYRWQQQHHQYQQ